VVVGVEAEFVESAVVIAPKTLEDVVGEAAILAGAVGELVAGKVVDADGDEDILVDMEGSGEALDDQTPSQPGSKSPPEVLPCSSTMRPSICVPRGLIWKT